MGGVPLSQVNVALLILSCAGPYEMFGKHAELVKTSGERSRQASIR